MRTLSVCVLAVTGLFSLGSAGQTPAGAAPACMEGMVMPGCLPAAPKSSPAAKPGSRAPACMAGMDMPGCRPAAAKPAPTAAKPSACMAGMDMPGCRPAEPEIPTQPVQSVRGVQEPEDPARRTGTAASAVPDLLREVSARKAMGVEDFLALAERTDPTLAQANALVRRAGQQARQAGLYPNPSVGYQGEQIRGGSYGGGEQGGYVQQTIVLGGKLGARREVYGRQGGVEQAGVEEQRYRVRGAVSQAFYDALTAQAMVAVRRQLLGVALDAVETVHQLANVGQADAPDVLQAEVEAEQAKVEYATAQRAYLQSFRVLAGSAGDAALPVVPLGGTLESAPELDAEGMLASLLAGSPAVKRSEQEVLVAEARLRAARREAVPDLTLRAGEQYNGEPLGGARSQAAGPQSFASAEIGLPLWNRNQGNIGAAAAEVERSRLEVARTRLALSAEAEALAEGYRAAQFRAKRYRTELIPRAQRAYELYLAKYQAMASAYPQVLVSQRTVFELQAGYLEALHDVWRNAVSLQNFTLGGGPGGIERSASEETR